MRNHFATFVREPGQFQSTMFPKPKLPPTVMNSSSTIHYATQQALPRATTNVTYGHQLMTALAAAQKASSLPTAMYTTPLSIGYSASTQHQGSIGAAPVVYPTPMQPTQMTPFKTRVYNSAVYRQQFPRPLAQHFTQQPTSYTPNTIPQFANQIPPIIYPSEVPIIEQPRYPPPGTYWQTLPKANRRVCYSCGLSGHMAEFCPNNNLPVCYGCKGIGHKRPQCPLTWLPDDRVTQIQQPLVPPTTIKPFLPLPPTTMTGKLYKITIKKPISSKPRTLYRMFILDTGTTHHIISDPSLLISFTPKILNQTVYLADRLHQLCTIGCGQLSITISNPPTEQSHIFLSDVLVSPSISTNIISVRKLGAENNISVLFTTTSAYIFRCGGNADCTDDAAIEINPTSPNIPLSPKDI